MTTTQPGPSPDQLAQYAHHTVTRTLARATTPAKTRLVLAGLLGLDDPKTAAVTTHLIAVDPAVQERLELTLIDPDLPSEISAPKSLLIDRLTQAAHLATPSDQAQVAGCAVIVTVAVYGDSAATRDLTAAAHGAPGGALVDAALAQGSILEQVGQRLIAQYKLDTLPSQARPAAAHSPSRAPQIAPDR